jgi:DNA-binding transcriptional LysR family regulator
LDAVLAQAGLRRSIALTVHDVHSAMAIISRCDMAALAPRRLLTTFADHYRLCLFDPPYRASIAPIEAIWRREQGDSPPIIWLRRILRAAAARL